MKKYKKLEGHWTMLGWRLKTQIPIWRRPEKHSNYEGRDIFLKGSTQSREGEER